MSQACHAIERFIGLDMAAAARYDCAAGGAVVFTTRCPDKPTPNEDGAVLIACGGDRGVLAVADGFGGQPSGGEASNLALTALTEAVLASLEAGGELRDGILNGFESANQRVIEMGVGAATTLTVLELAGDSIRPYHVGDSEVRVFGQRGKLKLATVAHSPVGYATEAGYLDQAEAIHHEDRHFVSNMVGSPEMRIEIGAILKLCERDTVLLASDGLFDNLHPDEIVQTMRAGPLTEGVSKLALACDARMRRPEEGLPSKPDDLTIIAFRRSRKAG